MCFFDCWGGLEGQLSHLAKHRQHYNRCSSLHAHLLFLCAFGGAAFPFSSLTRCCLPSSPSLGLCSMCWVIDLKYPSNEHQPCGETNDSLSQRREVVTEGGLLFGRRVEDAPPPEGAAPGWRCFLPLPLVGDAAFLLPSFGCWLPQTNSSGWCIMCCLIRSGH